MQKEPVEIPKNMVISVSWGNEKIISFLQGLPKDTLFGYSDAITFEGIKNLAWRNGVEVRALALRSPLRRKFGDYVLRVVRPYTPPTLPICADFSDIHFIELKSAPGNRKCRGEKCTRTISKGTQFIEVADLTDLPNGRRGYIRTSLCSECGTSLIRRKMKALLKVLPHDKVAVGPINKLIAEL